MINELQLSHVNTRIYSNINVTNMQRVHANVTSLHLFFPLGPREQKFTVSHPHSSASRITRLVLCQTRARRAKDRSLQAGISVHPLPAQGARATLALRAYITRKRPIRELSHFDATCKRNGAHFRMHFSFSRLAYSPLAPHLRIDFDTKRH